MDTYLKLHENPLAETKEVQLLSLQTQTSSSKAYRFMDTKWNLGLQNELIWVRVCIGLGLDLRSGLKCYQAQDKQNWRNKLSAGALQSQPKEFQTPYLIWEKKSAYRLWAPCQLTHSLANHTRVLWAHRWQKWMSPHWSHWGSASFHQLHLQPITIYTSLVPSTKKSKAEILCGHWGPFLS